MKEFKHPLFDEVYFYDKLASTSRQAEKLIREQTAQGNFLVRADEQTAGRGRGNNSWNSPLGGIWMTAAIYGLSVDSSLTIFTGIAIHKALSRLFPQLGTDLKLKWPNDIYLQQKKLSGILTSHLQMEKYHLLGIGLNSNVDSLPPELTDVAVSLRNYLGQDVDNIAIITEIFDQFAADLPVFIEDNLDFRYFNEHSLLKEKEITLDTDYNQFSGICRGINRSSALLIELKSGMIQPFYAGSVIQWSGSRD